MKIVDINEKQLYGDKSKIIILQPINQWLQTNFKKSL